jgi:hypothetical protein
VINLRILIAPPNPPTLPARFAHLAIWFAAWFLFIVFSRLQRLLFLRLVTLGDAA